MTSRRHLLDRLRIEHPLIQAPMAGVSTAAMAAAVSNHGALGSLGFGASDTIEATRLLEAFASASRGALNVNVFCHPPARQRADVEVAWLQRLRPEFERFGATPPASLREIYRSFLVDEAMQSLLLDARPHVVSFHFGLPPPDLIRRFKDAGVALLGSATTLHEAQCIQDAGLDAIVAQGYEAGGHRGAFDPERADDQLGVLALVEVLVARLQLPIIAAGGLMNGAAIGAALRLGASAAQLGTAFIDCPESAADAGYRRALHSDAAHHTVMTCAISGRPARSLPNHFTQLGDGAASASIPDYPRTYDAGKALHAAAKREQEFGYGAQWAGQGAPLVRSLPAAELVQRLVTELSDT